MNYQNACDNSMGDYPVQGNPCRKSPWYCQYIKPICSFIISVLLALSMSHLCEKYSTNNSFQIIRKDLSSLRNNMNSLSSEVRTLMESRDEFRSTQVLLEAVSPDNLKELVRTELQIYDADKTGRPDFALESLGGSILSTRDTATYHAGSPDLKVFGIFLCKQENSPRTIIQTGIIPGKCWAFKGIQGSVVIELIGHVHITGVTLEHIPLSISPTGETSTAPREFSVWALECVNDENGVLLGKFTYDNSGPPVQYFDVQNVPSKLYEIVEFKIHSNHGNSTFTCVYRVRVHGTFKSK